MHLREQHKVTNVRHLQQGSVVYQRCREIATNDKSVSLISCNINLIQIQLKGVFISTGQKSTFVSSVYLLVGIVEMIAFTRCKRYKYVSDGQQTVGGTDRPRQTEKFQKAQKKCILNQIEIILA